MKTTSKRQIIYIHGGDTWKPHEDLLKHLRGMRLDREDFVPDSKERWHRRLQSSLGAKYEVFRPDMPCAEVARYDIWKIWFDKLLRFVGEEPIFIGHSLGGIFLAKYFAENPDTKHLKALLLVAPPYADATTREDMADFILPDDVRRLAKLGDRVRLYFNKKDPVVAFADSKRYMKLLPQAQLTAFDDPARTHFITKGFPEIIRDIKSLV